MTCDFVQCVIIQSRSQSRQIDVCERHRIQVSRCHQQRTLGVTRKLTHENELELFNPIKDQQWNEHRTRMSIPRVMGITFLTCCCDLAGHVLRLRNLPVRLIGF